mgnify:CR=1 FL=1
MYFFKVFVNKYKIFVAKYYHNIYNLFNNKQKLKTKMQNLTGLQLRSEIEKIKANYFNSLISFEEMQKKANIFLNEINKRGKMIAKKHNKKFSKMSLSYILR